MIQQESVNVGDGDARQRVGSDVATTSNTAASDIVGTGPDDASARVEVLTFLFTDVEGSTRLWEQSPESMRLALERHDAILRDAITAAAGTVVKSTGDGLMAVFPEPDRAIAAAVHAQHGLMNEPWPITCRIRVRMGIHSGTADVRGGDFFGPTVNRTARVMAAGHGGQILLTSSTAALIEDGMPDRAALRDLGQHRLRDLEQPERLFQVTHPGLANEFAPLATLDVRPNNLPTQTSPFVGRDDELRELRARLDDPTVRLVTLTGPGGTGKTRLALRAAAAQVDRFDDGVFFVDAASASDTDAVLALTAAALGLPDLRDHSPLDELRRQLRARRILIVLDTFEHLTSAGPMLVELLRDCPGLKLLVTSREALRVTGEHVLVVPPLSLPAKANRATSAAELGQFEAIQLFVERARAIKADFRLTDDNAAAVAEICRRLDGLPLAIELATARLNLFSPQALRDRLGSRLKLLGGGARDLPARQQTLRATIDWSYQLLDPGEQRLFELLSVFANSSVEDVESIAEAVGASMGIDIDAIDGLGSLLDKSLLRQAAPLDQAAVPRVLMLETIREFAAERLDGNAPFAATVRDEHARFFAERASEAGRSASEAESDAGADGLAVDLDNVRIAWQHWVEAKDLDRLNAMLDGLWNLSEARGWYHVTVQLINDMLAVVTTLPPSPERLQQELTLLTSLARALTLLRGYTGEVEDVYLRALELFEGQREQQQAYPVLRSIASFHGFRGENAKALEFAQAILRLAEAEDDVSMRIDAEILLGANAGFTGDLVGALRHMDDAIAKFEAGGYRRRRLRLGIDPRVSCLTTSGFFLWLLGFPDSAVARDDRAVALAVELDHPYSQAYAHYHAGFLHHWRREPERVRDHATRALEIAESSDLPIWRALGTCLLGAATSSLGEPGEGVRLFEDGIGQYQGLRTPPVFWPFIRFMQAGVYLDANEPVQGLAHIDEALAIGGLDHPIAPLFLIQRGDVLLAGAGSKSDARTAYQAARDIARKFLEPGAELRAAVRLARIAEADERAERLASLRSVHERFTEGQDTPDLREATGLLS
jgi:predicted ATPase/class 3 adenylate cyclase